mmetsp:Transcript_30679/g.46464  ORF Transcript_30679/g.46464 Transcript_30679/m.46464 type:complete len:279 (-) Transcript_30679:162-998(-)
MEASNAVRQVEEILKIQDQFGKDFVEIKTPALFERLQRVGSGQTKLQVKKCLRFQVSCSDMDIEDLILEFEFPLDYPSNSTCLVRALSAKAVAANENDEEFYKTCSSDIKEYLKSFSGFECAELVLDWIIQNKDTCLINNESNGTPNNELEGKVKCFILRYNHLLSGPEHKKEKAMLDAAKKLKLQGGLLWGTPGVVIVVPPSTEIDAKDYGSECRTIGKRPGGVEEMWLPESGINEAGLGGLAQQKRGGKLQELDTSALRCACGDDEDLLRSVLGVK